MRATPYHRRRSPDYSPLPRYTRLHRQPRAACRPHRLHPHPRGAMRHATPAAETRRRDMPRRPQGSGHSLGGRHHQHRSDFPLCSSIRHRCGSADNHIMRPAEPSRRQGLDGFGFSCAVGMGRRPADTAQPSRIPHRRHGSVARFRGNRQSQPHGRTPAGHNPRHRR